MTGSGVVVDIVDDGLQANHVEIQPRIRLDLRSAMLLLPVAAVKFTCSWIDVLVVKTSRPTLKTRPALPVILTAPAVVVLRRLKPSTRIVAVAWLTAQLWLVTAFCMPVPPTLCTMVNYLDFYPFSLCSLFR